ncbi:hypothetical protein NIES592_08310 [Fischerella major NIES-592]|uniref:Uncharacterized protein n=1 Tax=Fischerella major NIES-592 TaxID=210994 RepID=A0A1U7H1M3_9CYAN|nr:hypothetical protein [Fischerella major]OKH14870.1 hypothetical protein NIES592_08310 [Fischerella major NIES-592]
MVDNLYKQYKLHANVTTSAVAKIGTMLDMSGKATMQDFLPFPDNAQERKKLPVSRETAKIYLELRSQRLIPPRVLGAFADIESQMEELANINS